MSIPPFIDAPEGVTALAPPLAPAPMLVAQPEREARGNVVLVPGFTGSKEDFIAILVPLAQQGWRVAALDLPGQNGNPALEGGAGANDLAGLAGAVQAAIDWFSPAEPVGLVGHSLGGLVTREVVIAAPGRVATWVPICSGPGALPADQWPPLVQLQQALGKVPLAGILQANEAADRARGLKPPEDEAVAAFLRARFLRNDPAALADMAAILLAAPDRTGQVAAASAGVTKVAVITGEKDDRWPLAQQRDMAAKLLAPWHVLPGCGHSPAAEDPQATAQLLHRILVGTDVG